MSSGDGRRRNRASYTWKPDMIRALREHMDLTQRELADMLEVRQQTISEWETGLHTPHRSTQKTLSMVAERAGFTYMDDTSSMNGNGSAHSAIHDTVELVHEHSA